MNDIDIVKRDEGGVNARILARETKADFRRVEAASLKIRTVLASAEGKRMFVRYFSTFQLSAHFIAVIARTRLDHEDVGKIEAAIRDHMDKVSDALNKAIDGAEALFKAHAITSIATYDTVPLQLDVGVMSSSGRRYLELLGKLDQLMPLLQTLEIYEVITTQAVDAERASLKRKVRDVANGARNFATRLRRAMNALDAKPSADAEATADAQDALERDASGAGGDGAGALPAPSVEAATETAASKESGPAGVVVAERATTEDLAECTGSTSATSQQASPNTTP